jgi:uncharacterized membrane protein YozB (DUF420 family)
VGLRQLPALNALLNAMAAALLLRGWFLIRHGRRAEHQRTMLMAFTVSVMFLISYLVYHFQVGSVRFQRQGAVRSVYFTILVSHTLLAAAVAPMAAVTLWRALHDRFDAHRRLARITLPLWLYVSVTGVVVYLMLYHL